MIRILRHYGQEYERGRGGTRGFDYILYFYSHGYAHNFLSRFPPSSWAVSALDRASVASAQPPAPEADIDAEAQAATFKNAAETGVPFCEKCERAKKQAQQKAPAT